MRLQWGQAWVGLGKVRDWKMVKESTSPWHVYYLRRKQRRIEASCVRVKQCRECGKDFVPGYKERFHYFCSEMCRANKRLKTKEKILASSRLWYQKNKEAVLAKERIRRVENKAELSLQRKSVFRRKMEAKWALLVKTCKHCNKEFRPANDRFEHCSVDCREALERDRARERVKTDAARAKRNAFLRAKRKKDPVFRLQGIVKWTITRALKKAGGRKHSSVIKALPYTIPQLKAHIEAQFNNTNGFTWDNYGKLWDIDHIVPQCLFRFTDTDSKLFRDCWALSNLRPLEKKANQKKNRKVIA